MVYSPRKYKGLGIFRTKWETLLQQINALRCLHKFQNPYIIQTRQVYDETIRCAQSLNIVPEDVFHKNEHFLNATKIRNLLRNREFDIWCRHPQKGKGVVLFKQYPSANKWICKHEGLSNSEWRNGIKMVRNVAAVCAVPGRSQNNRCRHCHNEVETLAHILGSCPHGEALRNARHHQVRSIIATACKDADYNTFEEVHGLSVTGTNSFLEAIMKERNKLPSVIHQQEEIPPMKERKTKLQNLVSAKEVCDIISCQDDNNALSELAMRSSYKNLPRNCKGIENIHEGEFIKRCLIILTDELCPQEGSCNVSPSLHECSALACLAEREQLWPAIWSSSHARPCTRLWFGVFIDACFVAMTTVESQISVNEITNSLANLKIHATQYEQRYLQYQEEYAKLEEEEKQLKKQLDDLNLKLHTLNKDLKYLNKAAQQMSKEDVNTIDKKRIPQCDGIYWNTLISVVQRISSTVLVGFEEYPDNFKKTFMKE
ncbi:hypothetical protein ANN_12797 [Periplaneta americana]|uniref:Uncharacterized protein n=1 Tax=Periplaneta americana TaxID=6978 RepID=A0ABQ8TJS6_PERAM|nr:hypothetical protein ANN_12797 [Periplaneta americana]